MATNKYFALFSSGGAAGSMDSIDPNNTDGAGTGLAVGDICTVTPDGEYETVYIAKSMPGVTEKLPERVLPNTNPGDWYWELQPEESVRTQILLYNNLPGGF